MLPSTSGGVRREAKVSPHDHTKSAWGSGWDLESSPGSSTSWGFPGVASGKEPTCQCRRHKSPGFDP